MNLGHSKITHLIAIGSGKGGVGKSTVSVNIALALNALGRNVGLLDADLMGPTIPAMLGIPSQARPEMDGELLIPLERYGIKVMSMGLLIDEDKPAAMRGAMVSKYLKTFLSSVAWGDLDYLIIDFPPGTGDTQISMCQAASFSGAVIVTTPQDISLKIATKGLKMFELVDVPILGIVENMSGFVCSNCQHETHLFGHNGGVKLSQANAVPFLGKVALDANIMESSDSGVPLMISDSSGTIAKNYLDIASSIEVEVLNLSATRIKPFVWMWESNIGAPEISDVTTDIVLVNLLQKDSPFNLLIGWSDGFKKIIDVRRMRMACKCAICREKSNIASDIVPVKINSVGNYAMRITWSDNHNTGIYSFKALREM